MTRFKQLQHLGELAGLLKQRDLAELARISAEREQSLACLAALDRPSTDATPSIAMIRAELAYQAWADGQRSQINARLARQTAARMAKIDDARQSFGRAELLARLAEKHRP